MPDMFRGKGNVRNEKKDNKVHDRRMEMHAALMASRRAFAPKSSVARKYRGFRRVTLSNLIKVMTAHGLHLFPFRTEKLNLATPMVLRKRESR